jgi:hypothetical protein
MPSAKGAPSTDAQRITLLTQGVCKARVRTVASMLLHIIRLMELHQLRPVSRNEIHDAGLRWLTDAESHTTRQPGKTSAYAFSDIAENWFRFHSVLTAPAMQMRTFDLVLERFVHHLECDRHLAPSTLQHYQHMVSRFLRWAGERFESISEISLFDITEFLQTKRDGGWKSSSLAGQCQPLRTFFRFCESQGWSDFTIARGTCQTRILRTQFCWLTWMPNFQGQRSAQRSSICRPVGSVAHLLRSSNYTLKLFRSSCATKMSRTSQEQKKQRPSSSRGSRSLRHDRDVPRYA